MENRKVIYDSYYVSLFSDGELGLSDGVGYVDTLERSEVKELYKALKEIFENAEK